MPPPSVADSRPDSFKVDRRLPSPRPKGSVPCPAAGRRSGSPQPTGSRKEGTKMSASAPAVNSVTLAGNLTADPIIKQLDDDRKVCQLRVAVNNQKDQPPLFIDIATY